MDIKISKLMYNEFWRQVGEILDGPNPLLVLDKLASTYKKGARFLFTRNWPEWWVQLGLFLNHPEMKSNPDFALQQLRLCANGERGVSLSDNCVVLPLFPPVE